MYNIQAVVIAYIDNDNSLYAYGMRLSKLHILYTVQAKIDLSVSFW